MNHNNDYKRACNCLKKYRKARGFSQGKAASVLGFKGASIVSRWERGVCLPNTLNTFKLAALYRTMVDALFIDTIRALRNDIRKKERLISGSKR